MDAVIDGAVITSRSELHDSLFRQLDLPDWYGRNLDALYDCLTDLSEPASLRLVHFDTLSERLGHYAAALRAVLRDASAENPLLRCTVEA